MTLHHFVLTLCSTKSSLAVKWKRIASRISYVPSTLMAGDCMLDVVDICHWHEPYMEIQRSRQHEVRAFLLASAKLEAESRSM